MAEISKIGSRFEHMGLTECALYLPNWMKPSAAGATSYGTGLFVGSGSDCGGCE